MEDDPSAYLAEREREKVVSVLNWVAWDLQLLFQDLFSLVSAYFTLPSSTRRPLQGSVTDALACVSFSALFEVWLAARTMRCSGGTSESCLRIAAAGTLLKALLACLQ